MAYGNKSYVKHLHFTFRKKRRNRKKRKKNFIIKQRTKNQETSQFIYEMEILE